MQPSSNKAFQIIYCGGQFQWHFLGVLFEIDFNVMYEY